MRANPEEGIFCQLTGSNPAITGVIRYSEKIGCQASLYRFREYFFSRSDKPLTLELANGYYATLLDHFTTTSGSGGSANNLAYYSDIISNRALLGLNKFPDNALVHSLHFLLPGSEHILLSREAESAARQSLEAWQQPPSILEIETENGHLSIGITAADRTIDFVGHLKVYFNLAFSEPVKLDRVDYEIRNVSSFFSACLGNFLVARGVTINISKEDTNTQSASSSRFRVYAGRSRDNPADSSLTPHSSPFLFSVDDAKEKELFSKAFRNWLRNAKNHSKQVTLMQSALLNAGKASDSRFLNACRWLDVTSSARPLTQKNSSEYRALLSDTKNFLVERGFKRIIPRAIQALGRTAEETHDERFARLAPIAFDGIDIPRGNSELDKDLKSAFSLRGTFAHGTTEDIDTQRLIDATHTIEALAFLMTLDELTEIRQRRRTSEHPLLFHYIHSAGFSRR